MGNNAELVLNVAVDKPKLTGGEWYISVYNWEFFFFNNAFYELKVEITGGCAATTAAATTTTTKAPTPTPTPTTTQSTTTTPCLHRELEIVKKELGDLKSQMNSSGLTGPGQDVCAHCTKPKAVPYPAQEVQTLWF